MIKLLVLLIILVSPHVVHADLNKSDIPYEVAYTAFHTRDWLQTRWIATHCTPDATGKYMASEVNPILGKCPTVGMVNTYFALTYIARLAIIHALPNGTLKRGFQVGTIGLEIAVTEHNAILKTGYQF